MAVAPVPSTPNHHHPIFNEDTPQPQLKVQQPSIPDIEMSDHSHTESDTSEHEQENDQQKKEEDLTNASQETEMQETQPVEDPLTPSQKKEKAEWEARIWGILTPCAVGQERIYFMRPNPTYTFGRDPAKNDFAFPHTKISAF